MDLFSQDKNFLFYGTNKNNILKHAKILKVKSSKACSMYGK